MKSKFKSVENEIDWDKSRKICESYAKKSGFSSIAEDFASYAILEAIEKKHDEIFVERRFVDFLRKTYGRSGTPGGDAKQEGVLRSSEFIEDKHRSELSDRRCSTSFAGKSLRFRAFALLKEEGFTGEELAKIWGKSSMSVSNVFRKERQKRMPKKQKHVPQFSLEAKVMEHIRYVLELHKGNKTHAARDLGISLRCLRYRLNGK